MTLAQRLKKMVPGKVINYQRPKEQKKALIEVRPSPKKKEYKVPPTPRVSGKGWGY